MRLLLPALVAVATTATPAFADRPARKPLCQDAENRLAAQRERTPGVHPLGQEPPANQTLAVLREQNGCTRPADIRRNVGRHR